jgi:hypothetical protein
MKPTNFSQISDIWNAENTMIGYLSASSMQHQRYSPHPTSLSSEVFAKQIPG